MNDEYRLGRDLDYLDLSIRMLLFNPFPVIEVIKPPATFTCVFSIFFFHMMTSVAYHLLLEAKIHRSNTFPKNKL